jgi:hypothetical protein
MLEGSPADFPEVIAGETGKWAKVIKFAGIVATIALAHGPGPRPGSQRSRFEDAARPKRSSSLRSPPTISSESRNSSPNTLLERAPPHPWTDKESIQPQQENPDAVQTRDFFSSLLAHHSANPAFRIPNERPSVRWPPTRIV